MATVSLPEHRIRQVMENPGRNRRGNPFDIKRLFLFQLYQEILSHRHLFVMQLINLNAHEMSTLKRELTKAGFTYSTVRTSLFLRAASEMFVSDKERQMVATMRNMFTGTCGVAFSNGEETKLIKDLGATLKSLQNKVFLVGGKLDSDALSHDQLIDVSKMPPLADVRAELLSLLKNPAEKLVQTLSPERGLNEL
ncbi:hypothetical protein HK096_010068, partial [Nowakowskiella sp. JEL0078]